MTFPSTYPSSFITRTRMINSGAKIGATAGGAVNAATDVGRLATVPAGQTAATLVVPLTGLRVGDTLSAVFLVGQIESAGNAVTVDLDIRKLTSAAADLTDASVATAAQLSVTADTIISSTNSTATLGTADVVAANESFYALITVTTGASTDVDLMGVAVTVIEAA